MQHSSEMCSLVSEIYFLEMKHFSIGWIITLFAIAHAVATAACRAMNIDDSIALTILTMAMTVIICIRERLNVEFTAVNVILVNIVGYVLGITFASIIGAAIRYSPAIYSLSTFITTELLGWGLLWFCSLFPGYGREEEALPGEQLRIRLIIIAVGVVLSVRILIDIVLATSLFADGSLFSTMSVFLSNSIVLLILVSATILFLQYLHKEKSKFSTLDVFMVTLIFFIVTASISALMIGYGLPLSSDGSFTFKRFVKLFVVGIISEAAIYSIIYIIDYALAARRSMENERAKANLAKYRYLNLKQQVNPHFLFNSLNVLDYLVADDENERAREYIQKLAGIYRYMLSNEAEPLVCLRDEMEYTGMYIDLLKLRFQEGLDIQENIKEEDLSKYVVTYSVQMLIENAVKHNSISKDKPLHISILTNGDTITVSNNLAPKINPSASTGIGLKYIHKNYMDRSGKDIIIVRTEREYRVSLPLL